MSPLRAGPDTSAARIAGGDDRTRSAIPTALQDFAVRTAARFVGSGRLLILTYHRILPAPDAMLPDDVDARTFAWQMQALRAQFTVLPLSEGAARLTAGTLPARAACVTFDDGYRNNFDVALPVLTRLGMPATFFVATGFLDGGRMWNDGVIEALRGTREAELDFEPLGLGRWRASSADERRTAAHKLIDAIKYREPAERDALVARIAAAAGARLPDDLMMSSAQVAELARAGMEVGAHTVTHPILARMQHADAAREINEGRQRLRELTGRPVTTFAYPNGRPNRDYGAAHVRLVRDAGFTVAVSTAWGAARRGSHPLQLPRVAPWDRSRLRYSLRLLAAYFEAPESVAVSAP